MKKRLVILIFSLIILTALFFRVRSSLPTVRVEGESLRWEDFSAHRSGLLRFRDLNKENVSDKEVEEGVIVAFIQDVLVKKELERRGRGEEDARQIVMDELGEEKLKEVEDATGQLYGLTLEDFEKYILLPQARRMLLAQEFAGEENPDEWLEKSFNEAKISVYLLRWKWNDGELKERF